MQPQCIRSRVRHTALCSAVVAPRLDIKMRLCQLTVCRPARRAAHLQPRARPCAQAAPAPAALRGRPRAWASCACARAPRCWAWKTATWPRRHSGACRAWCGPHPDGPRKPAACANQRRANPTTQPTHPQPQGQPPTSHRPERARRAGQPSSCRKRRAARGDEPAPRPAQVTDLRAAWEVDCVLRDILTGLGDCSAPARRLRYRCARRSAPRP